MFGIRKLVKGIWDRRPTLSDLMEVAGFVALVYGIAVFSVPVASIVGGILLIVAGGLRA